MSAAIDIARRAVAWMADDFEREDRLGDLEEIGRRYVREAAGICLSILLRRVRRAITNGGIDMARIVLWAALSVAAAFMVLTVAGATVFVYMQPFEWIIILVAMLGFAIAGRRLGAWPGILADLRRAGELGGRARSERRAAYLREARDQKLHSFDFAHLDGVLRIARDAAPAEADRLISGGIALFREKSRQRIAVVEQTVRDAYAASAIAMIFGLIHLLEHGDLPVLDLGHILGGALCAPFFGLILGRAVLAPVASQLAALHEQQAREMDALRLSLGNAGQSFPAETFEVLASGLAPQA